MTVSVDPQDHQLICEEADLPVGKSKRIVVNQIPVALFHVENGYYAIEDTCSHQGASLAFGTLEGHTVACPRHGAQFDIRSGKVISLPALRGVRKWNVLIENGRIYLSASPADLGEPELLRL